MKDTTRQHNWWPVGLESQTTYTVGFGNQREYENVYEIVEVCTACHKHRRVPSERER